MVYRHADFTGDYSPENLPVLLAYRGERVLLHRLMDDGATSLDDLAAAARGALPKNTASRKISRMSARIKAPYDVRDPDSISAYHRSLKTSGLNPMSSVGDRP